MHINPCPDRKIKTAPKMYIKQPQKVPFILIYTSLSQSLIFHSHTFVWPEIVSWLNGWQCRSIHDFGPVEISQKLLTKCGTDIHGCQRMKLTDFRDYLTFHVVPPAGQSLHLFINISQHLWDGLAEMFVQTFVAPRWCILMNLVISWQFL